MSRKAPYRGNARFIELGSVGAPFRTTINVDHISNIRFEQRIKQIDAEYDDDGRMTRPPQEIADGWNVVFVIGHGAGGQSIFFPEEQHAAECYNTVLDLIQNLGIPIQRMTRIRVPNRSTQATPGNDDLEDEMPDLTDEELDQLENPEIDVDSIAEAVDQGLNETEDDERSS